MCQKIDAPPKHSAHLSLWLGLAAAILLAIGSIIFTHAHEEKKRNEKFNWMRPVPSDTTLHATLTEEQYRVTRENGTETLFHNMYWDNDRPGIYVDIITGEPLFSSIDKFDSGMGLPAFSKPIAPEHVVEKLDTSHDMQRTEVRAAITVTHISATFFLILNRPPAAVISLTPPPCISFQSKKCTMRATADSLSLFPNSGQQQ